MPFPIDFGDFEPEQRGPFDHSALLMPSDGDTPLIEQPIRMVSIDTPEKSYGGAAALGQEKLDACKARLEGGFYNAVIPQETRAYLAEKLTVDAGARHIEAARTATAKFIEFLDARLQEGERRRRLAVFPSGEIVDTYGRLLAYIAPWFDRDELPPLDDPRRRTFNLQMLEEGWAALFVVYPSLPKQRDFELAVAAAEAAFANGIGQWAGGPGFLPGYEYRMSIKLGAPLVTARKGNLVKRFYIEQDFQSERMALEADGWTFSRNRAQTPEEFVDEAFQRHAVDIETKELVGRFRFDLVLPWKRMWVWNKDRDEAVTRLGLIE